MAIHYVGYKHSCMVSRVLIADTIHSTDMPCISLACGISDFSLSLCFLLICMFPGFCHFPALSVLWLYFPTLCCTFCCFPMLLAHFLLLSCAPCHFPAPSGTSAHLPHTLYNLPLHPLAVIPLSFMFHLCTLIPRLLSTFCSI